MKTMSVPHTLSALSAGMPQDLRGKTEERGDARTSFADVLAASERRVNFSRHAVRRLEEREIVHSPQELERLDGMVDRMAAKGARQALITVLDGEHAKDNIFTNIDSAAIL